MYDSTDVPALYNSGLSVKRLAYITNVKDDINNTALRWWQHVFNHGGEW